MNTVSSFVTELFRGLLQISWQAAVLVALILLSQLMFRKQISVGWRYGLWFLLLVRLLMPSPPPSAFSIFNLAWLKSTHRALVLAPTVGTTTAGLPAPAFSQAVVPPEPKLDLYGPTPDRSFSQPSLSGETLPKKKINWFKWAAGIWALGVVFFGFRLVWTNLRFRSRITRQPIASNPEMRRDFADCLALFGLKQRVGLIETDLVDSPAVYGLFQKHLLLPLDISKRFLPRELHYIFLHELAHIKRRDLEINWLAAILQVIHWFNPVLWFAFARMRADRELATDALALSRASRTESTPYGETIIKLAEWLTGEASAPALVGIAEDKKEIKRRILMIARSPARTWPFISVALLLFVGAFACTDVLQSGPDSAVVNGRDTLGETSASQQAEKLIVALKQKSRWTFGPRAMLFGDEDGEVSGGLLRSVQIRPYAMNAEELSALGGPVATGIPPSSAAADSIQWNFENDLSSTDGHARLIPKATIPAKVPDFSFVEASLSGNRMTALRFSAGTCFELANPFKDPVGNPLLVDYTVIMDVMFPDMKSRWAALWQTDSKNQSDAEWLVSTEKGIGITDTYGGHVPEGEWHRLALVLRGSDALFLSYIDGKEVQRKLLDVKDEYYNRRLDDDVLSWTDTFTKLRNLQDPTARTAVQKFNIRLENGARLAQHPPSGLPGNGAHDPVAQIATVQAWAAQIPTTDLVTTLEGKSRWTLGPTALLFADENGENAGGLVDAVQVRNYAMTDEEVQQLEALEVTRETQVAPGAQVARWDFNGNLESSTGGAALVPACCPPAAQPEFSFESRNGESGKSEVARFSRGTFFKLPTGFRSNGTDPYLLNYSVVLDVKFEERPVGWVSLWQNDIRNVTDADWFLNKKGQLGIRDFYGGSVEDRSWNRLALVVDGKNGTISHFVNGRKVRTKLMILEDEFGRRGGAEPNLNFIIALITELSLRDDPVAAQLVQNFSRRMHNHPDPESAARFVALDVKVADKEGGNPIGDATIDYQMGESNEDFFPEFVKSDSSGRGQINVQIPIAERIHVTARAPGYAANSATISGQDLLAGTKRAVLLELARSIKIGGVVISQDSAPVANAIVRILFDDGAPAQFQVRPWYDLIQTSADGTWKADFIPPNVQKVTIIVYHPLYKTEAFVTLRDDSRFDELRNFTASFQLGTK